ncbi:hypothetical protein SDC9_168321 [bioreactor metagenome]|uniref:Uncharacterized protein n=1 Tax=bioreactor metagenome TaxID=1076179 RepID=A0A645G4Q5_9ZZZZ
MPNQVFAWSSCVASYHYLLRGRLMGYLHYAKIWDMAGGMALMRNAGFVTLTESGTEFACTMEDFRFCSERKFFVEGNLFSAPSREIAEHIRTRIRAEKN